MLVKTCKFSLRIFWCSLQNLFSTLWAAERVSLFNISLCVFIQCSHMCSFKSICIYMDFFLASSCFLEIPFLNYSLIGCDLRALFGLNRSGGFFHASPRRGLCLIFYCVPVIHFYPIIRLRFFHSSKDDNSFLNFIHNHTQQYVREYSKTSCDIFFSEYT